MASESGDSVGIGNGVGVNVGIGVVVVCINTTTQIHLTGSEPFSTYALRDIKEGEEVRNNLKNNISS